MALEIVSVSATSFPVPTSSPASASSASAPAATPASEITLELQALLHRAAATSPEVAEQLEEVLTLPIEDPELPPGRPDTSHLWTPQPGPQTQALLSKADLLFYGGSAGGGKSDLLLGLALTRHQRSIIYRKEGAQNRDFVERLQSDILGTDRGWSSKDSTWTLTPLTRFPGHRIVFGGIANPGDEQKYKGRPNDLIGFDEAVDFPEAAVRFLMTWNRSTLQGQRTRVVLASNPPAPQTRKQTSSGLWLIDMFAPWLDPRYKDPLGLGRPEPGTLRWYVRLPGEKQDQEWSNGIPFLHENPHTRALEPVIPQSRTFIPASVYDNVYLRGTSYLGTLQALHEPLRSIMLHGDFSKALGDQPLSLFPIQWVRDAQQRWKDLDSAPAAQHPRNAVSMTALGLDVARGGADSTVGAPRHETYFDTLHATPGSSTPDGPSAAGKAVSWVRDGATIVVDAVGAGGSCYDHLHKTLEAPCRAYIGSQKASLRDRTGKFVFTNYRSQWYWKLREALDPATPETLYLPDDPDLTRQLTAHTYEILTGGKIKVVPKETIAEILGESPDKADAVVMAWSEPHESSWTPSEASLPARGESSTGVHALPLRRGQHGPRAPLRGPIPYTKKVI